MPRLAEQPDKYGCPNCHGEGLDDMKCPICGHEINPAAMLGSISTPAKAQAARENAKLGGWPKGKKRGKRKRMARRQNAEVSDGGPLTHDKPAAQSRRSLH